MADLSLVFDLLAKDRASAEVGKVGKSMDDAGKHASGLGDKISGMFDLAKGAALGAGLAVGAAFFGSIDQAAGQNKLAAQLGLNPAESAKAGKLAGDLYAQNYGDSLESVNDAVRAVAANITSDINSPDMSELTSKALDLSQVFGVDVADSTKAVSNLIETGLVQNASQAMDVITTGFQGGNDAAGDWLDTLNEYSVQFQKLGISGQAATNLISQGMQAGARDSDLVADAIKEFSIRAVDGSDTTAAGFKSIGLNAGDMAAAIGAGGSKANGALEQVFQHLRGITDPVKQAQAATALFGTQAGDLGSALFALDPATAGAAQSIANVDGAASRMDATIAQGIGPRLEMLKRGAQQAATQGMTALINGFTQGRAKGSGWQSSLQNLSATFAGVLKPALAGVASFLRGTVLPAASAVFGFLGRHETTVRVIAGVIATVLTPAIVAWGVKSTISAAKSVTAWTTSTLAASGGAIKQVVSAGRVVAGWVLMGVQSMIRAAQMAAAWVIAMGPVGWIITAVVALVALIILNWDRVKGWTIAAWHAIIGAIKGAWNAIIGAIKTAWNWILGVIKGAWNWVVNATKTAWNAVIGAVKTAWQWLGNTVRNGISAVVEFVKGLPGRILRGLGRIGSLLLNVGKDLLSGLWNGIKSAGHWLLEKVGQFFGDLLPGWIRDILGISSPSTMFAAFGRDSMRGFAAGIDAGAGTALAAARRATLAVAGAGSGSLGFSAPGYDMGGAGGGMGGRTYVTTVSGVASPEAVAAVVDRAQRTNEFLAGVGS